MAEIASSFKRINSNDNSDLSDSSSIASTYRSSSSSSVNWTIHYKPAPQKPESKGVWGEYQSRDEFLAMHLR